MRDPMTPFSARLVVTAAALELARAAHALGVRAALSGPRIAFVWLAAAAGLGPGELWAQAPRLLRNDAIVALEPLTPPRASLFTGAVSGCSSDPSVTLDAADLQMIAMQDLEAGNEGYPESLEILVEGVTMSGDASGKKLKFLRRIPLDPLTGSNEWGMRSYQDKPDSTSWGGQNVFDVYTKSEGTALDGTKYKDW